MLHDKQYLLTEKAYMDRKLTKTWNLRLLPCGWTLSWEPKLDVKHSKDWSVVLVGMAWQIDPERESDIQILLEEACGMDTDGIIDMISTWCGRFIVIAGSKVYADCNTQLAVFYADGALSCSTAVLCDYLNIKVKKPNIAHAITPDFVPGESTQYPQIRRLMIDQIYNLKTKKTERRSLLPGGILDFETRDERDAYFFRCFVQSIHNLKKQIGDKKIMVALTGGVDSRTSLACIELSGIDYSCFTLEHGDMSSADRKIPPILCRLLGREYRYIPRTHVDPEKTKEFDIHTGCMNVDTDRLFYGNGQYQAIPEDGKSVVILRSAIWETFFGDYVLRMPVEERKHMTKESIKKYYKWIAFDEEKLKVYCDWLKRVQEQEPWEEEACISEVDRMYWTMRSGCWLSDLEQSLTLVDNLESYQVLNSTLFFRILFGYVDPNDRPANKEEERRLTKAACPKLAKVPYEADIPHVASRREKQSRWHRTNRRLLSLYGPRPVLSRYKARVKSSVKKLIRR